MNVDMDLDKALGLANEYISGETVVQDFEQAVYWLSLIAPESKDAQELLARLSENGMGIECAVPFCSEQNNISAPEITDQKLTVFSRQELESDATRCINCGATNVLTSWDARAAVCNSGNGGCGSVQHITIVECGLEKGLAIQPYTLEHGIKSFLGNQISSLKYDSSIDPKRSMDILVEISRRIKECAIIDHVVPKDVQRNLTIVPVPSSKRRKIQPVYELAEMIGDEKIPCVQALVKHSNVESKNRPAGSELFENEITCKAEFAADSVLLFDDTYGEGATVRACLKALRRNGVRRIYLLTLCKNVFGGIKANKPHNQNGL